MGNNSSTKDNEILKSEIIGIGSVILVTIFSGLGLVLTNFAMAESSQTVEKTATVHVEYSCSMSQTINSAHTLTLDPGRSQENIGTSTFNVTCNDLNGYAIYAVGYSGDSEGNTDMIANGLAPTYNIKTGTSGTDSYWAVKLATGNSNISILNSFNDYHAVPTSYTKVAQKTSGAASNESALTSTYKVNVSGIQAVGTYEGKVRFALMNPSTADCPEGYELKDGVCKRPVFSGITTMQEMTPAICAAEPTPSASDTEVPTKQLIDTRDNKLYWVAKLADGNCWMTQNLDLDLSTTKTLTPDDTNITSNWTPDKNTVVGANLSSSNWATFDYTHQFSWDGGNYYLPDGRDKNNTACTNTDLSTCTNDVTSIAPLTDASILGNTNTHYHVGNLYTWTAALAMNDSGSVSTTDYTNPVSTSICPKGWRLPTAYGGNSSTNGEFKNLVLVAYDYSNNTSDGTLRAEPLFFAHSGSVYTGSLGGVGSFGFYWSSTVYSSSYAYDLYFDSTYVFPLGYNRRNYGLAVRCIAQ